MSIETKEQILHDIIQISCKDGYFEGVIRNYHSFGNETAVDEFLSSMKLYASDYSEKTALRSGNSERVVAIMIIISALLVLGLAIFSFLFDKFSNGIHVDTIYPIGYTVNHKTNNYTRWG